MAVRDILARFRVQVDQTQLDSARARITTTKAALVGLAQKFQLGAARVDTSALVSAQAAATRLRGELERARAANPDSPGVKLLAADLQAAEAAAAKAAAAVRTVAPAAGAVGAQAQAAGGKLGAMGAQAAAGAAQATAAEGGLIGAVRAGVAAFRAQAAAGLAAGHKAGAGATLATRGLLGIVAAARRATTALRSMGSQGAAAEAKIASGAGRAAASTGGLGGVAGFAQTAFIGLAATLTAGMFSNFIGGALETADALGKTSKALGVGIEDLQVFEAFAVTSGASTEDLKTALRTLAKSMSDFDRGSGEALLVFQDLGFEARDAAGNMKPLSVAFVELGTKLQQMEDGTQKTAMAQRMFGDAATKLLPGFSKTTTSVEEQMAALRDLAVVYDKDFIAQTEAANDNMYLLGLQFQKIRAAALNFLIPIFRDVAASVTPAISHFAAWAKQTGFLDRAFKALGAFGVVKLLGYLITKLGGLTGMLKFAARFVLRFLLPFLIFDDIFTMLRGGESVIGRVLDSLFGAGTAAGVVESLKGAFQVTFDWVKNKGIPIAKDFFAALVTKAKPLVNTALKWFREDLPGVLRTFAAGVNGAVAVVEIFWGSLAGDDAALADGQNRLNAFLESARGFGSDLKFVLTDVWEKLPGVVQLVLELVSGMFSGIFGDLIGVAWNWSDETTAAVSALGETFAGIWDDVKDGAQKMFEYVSKIIETIGDGIDAIPFAGALKSAAGAAVDAATTAVDRGLFTYDVKGKDNQATIDSVLGSRTYAPTIVDQSTFTSHVSTPDAAGAVKAIHAEGRKSREFRRQSSANTLAQLGGSTR